jgi:aldehyde:ferredoxin oxidoreductase
MIKDCVGKILFIDLSNGKIHEEIANETLYRDFLGGYGVGARILLTCPPKTIPDIIS